MKIARFVALTLALTLFAPGLAAAASGVRGVGVVPQLSNPILQVQQQDIPDVVRLLVQRARRAERRGDFATADELYALLLDMGYLVARQPRPGETGSQGDGPAASGSLNNDRMDDDDDGDDDGGDDDDGDDD